MLLGRRLLQTPTRVDAQRVAPSDALLDTLNEHNRFFCDMMENIPPSFYFPTDAEANWKQSAPRKYHKVRRCFNVSETNGYIFRDLLS